MTGEFPITRSDLTENHTLITITSSAKILLELNFSARIFEDSNLFQESAGLLQSFDFDASWAVTFNLMFEWHLKMHFKHCQAITQITYEHKRIARFADWLKWTAANWDMAVRNWGI